MKKIIVSLMLSVVALIASAHTITPAQCSSDGKATFYGTYFDNNQWIYVHINTAGIYFAGGSQDSVFKTSGSTFTIRISQPVITSAVSITVRYNTTGNAHMNGGTIAVGGDHAVSSKVSCRISMLPVTISNFVIVKTNDGIKANWISTSEANVDHYEIQGSTDGVSFSTIGQIAANNNGNNAVAQTYSLSITFVKYAGMGSIGMLIIGSIFASKFRKKAILIPVTLALVLGFGFTSCTKSVVAPTPTVSAYKFARLVSVDKDGTKGIYSETKKINN